MEVKEEVNGQALEQQNTEETDAVKLFMELLQQQGMKEPSQEFMEVLQYIAGMQLQLAAMVDELQGVREQLGKMQESQPKEENAVLTEKVSHLQNKVTRLARHFTEAKDRLIHTAEQAVSAFKEKGREEMNRVLQKGIFRVKAMLLKHKDCLMDTLTSYEQTANQIDSIGDELKQIANSAANVGRLLVGKGTKEISEEKPGVALTRFINQPIKKHIAKLKKQMDGMDRAIQKLDNLSSSLVGAKIQDKSADVPVKAEAEPRISVKEKLSEMKVKAEQQKKAPEKMQEKKKEEMMTI